MTNSNYFIKLDTWLKRPFALALLVLLHLVLSVVGTNYKSINGDERGYYSYAARCLKGNMMRTSKWDDSKTSVLAVGLLPRAITQLFNPGLEKNDGGNADLLNGRLVILAFSVVALFYLWLLLKKIALPYGMLALPFAIIDPLWLSYATLFISDLPVGLFTIAVLYHTWAYFNSRSTKDLLLASFAAGLGTACKFSFMPALSGLLIALFIVGFREIRKDNNWKQIVKAASISIVVIVLTLNICYPFDGRFSRLNELDMKSDGFKSLGSSWVGSIPLPLPDNIVYAADLLSFHQDPKLPEKDRTFYGGPYLFNQFHFDEGPKWYYYWALLLLKTPLFVLILFLIGAIAALASAPRNKLFFWATITFVFYYLFGGWFNTFQIGARHMMAVQPLLFIVAAFGIHKLFTWLPKVIGLSIFIVGSLASIVSIGYYFPYMLPYTNELILNKKTAHWYIGEGAIDYHQSDDFLADFLSKNPEYKYPGVEAPMQGKFAISASLLWSETWIRKNPLAIKLWKRKPDKVERFVVFIYEDVQ